jgi:hypothetical protein
LHSVQANVTFTLIVVASTAPLGRPRREGRAHASRSLQANIVKNQSCECQPCEFHPVFSLRRSANQTLSFAGPAGWFCVPRQAKRRRASSFDNVLHGLAGKHHAETAAKTSAVHLAGQ